MLVVDASGTKSGAWFVDAVFFTSVKGSRVCSSHSRHGLFSSIVVGDWLACWSGSPSIVFVWLTFRCCFRCAVGKCGVGLALFVSVFVRFPFN
jgi:hypothetical protein